MKFIVEGKPQGKARARTFYNRQRGKMQSMTPQNTVDYENLVRWSYKAAGGTYYDKTPLNVSVRAIYDIPVSFSKVMRKSATEGKIKPCKKPDSDNIAKAILDALNGVAYRKNYFIVNPLAYWSNEYLWNYIESEHIEVNPLYGEGFTESGVCGLSNGGEIIQDRGI